MKVSNRRKHPLGFTEMMKVKKPSKAKAKPEKPVRKRNKSKSKRAEEQKPISKEDRIKLAVDYTFENFDKKLYGLVVPESCNFLPDFLSMVKLMTFKL